MCPLALLGSALYPVLVHRLAVSLRASFPRSVALAQLRFASFAVASSREDFHLQDRAHAGRTHYTAPPYNTAVYSFIETKLFTRLVDDYLSDEEYRELQVALIGNPNAGDVVPGSGGVRKLRWRAAGRGKRGGYRVIYFAKLAQGVIWMLTMYPKNVAENIPAHVLRQIRKEVNDG